jgi:single-stranded-DNA-specific exonuclease
MSKMSAIRSGVRWATTDLMEVPEELLGAYDFVTAQLLVQRGITTVKAAEEFLHPRLDNLGDQKLLPDLEKAVAKIRQAIAAKEWIVVYGDYDVDGVTSSTLLISAIKELGGKAEVYLPERLKEGYGLNDEAIRKLHSEGCDLIITVDNGTTSVAEVELIRQLGMEVIIIDHHHIPEVLPEAFALINPHLPKSPYPFSDAAAVGVTYYVVRELLGDEKTKEYLDLVALGTIADVVPLVGDNRLFAIFGLEQLNKTERLGIRALIDVAGLKGQELTVYHVGFQLGPRLNAAGRLDHAKLAFDLLNATTLEEAYRLAHELNGLNARRQELTDRILQEAQAKSAEFKNEKVIVLGGEDWSIGVAGIVAGRLVEQFSKPALVFEFQEDCAKGSCRSVEGVHIVELISKASEFVEHFGGHAKAAGLSVTRQNFDSFKQALQTVAKNIDERLLSPSISISVLVDAGFVTPQLLETVERFAPFGFGNTTPIFGTRRVKLLTHEMIGNSGSHLRLTFIDDAGDKLQVMAFDGWKLIFDLNATDYYDVAFTTGTNVWKDRKFMQNKLIGVRKSVLDTAWEIC